MWPWAAASLAVHGLLFAWLNGKADMPGSEAAVAQLVQIEILPGNAPQPAAAAVVPEPRKQPAETADTPTEAAKPFHNPVPAERAEQAAEAKPEMNAVALPAGAPADVTTDATGQQLAVREHLERFKYYPASASRRGIAGDVEVGFRLRPDGSAEQVLVLASSGYEILDQAALETVSRAQPFPAVGGQYQFRLRFRRL